MQAEWIDKDFYQDLGVKPTASASEIKKVYRKLARELHPDANPGNKTAEEKFKKISEAYAVLGDPQKRKEYDETKEMARSGAFNQNMRYQTGNNGFSTTEFNLGDLFGGFQTGETRTNGFGNIFGDIFGNQGRASRQAPVKGQDIQATYTIGFKEAVLGTTVTLQLPQQNAKTKKFTVKIPPGINDGGKIKLAGKGNPGPAGSPAGDLYITIQVTPDKRYLRQGNDLKIKVPVAFQELVLGTVLTIPTITGKKVSLKIPAGTANERILRVKGEGVPKANQTKGDLLVQLQVKVPEKLSAKAKELLEKYAQEETKTGFNPRADWN